MIPARAPVHWLVALLVLSAACGGETEAEAYARAVVEDLVARDYGAAVSRYERYEELVLSAEAAPIWRRAVEHSDSTVREWSMDALSRIGLPEDVALVQAGLDDPASGVREGAAEALVRIDPDVAREQFRLRVESVDAGQVILAARGFAALGDPGEAPRVIARLQDPSLSESARAALTQPLAALGGDAIVTPLVEIALDSTLDAELRRLAAEAALSTGSVAMREELERLRQADDDYVRELAGAMLDEAR